MLHADWQEILWFLSNEYNSEYAPQGGEITGILKEMGDEMSKDLTTATNEETTAIKDLKSSQCAELGGDSCLGGSGAGD